MNFRDRIYRSALFQHLTKLKGGRLTIAHGSDERVFGDDSTSGLAARVTVHESPFFRRVVQRGELGVAESWMDGDWSCDDLTSFVRIFVRDAELTESIQRRSSRLSLWLSRARHWLRRNSLATAKANISAHYDLGNEFFASFLDDTLSYSCGIFDDQRCSMRDASLSKIRRACDQLDLRCDDHLLEIGTGWGELSAVAADEFDCRVTTTTISKAQFDAATEKIAVRDLGHRVTVLLSDYRELDGQFDKLVSIEMIEAVGHQYLQTFFDKCSALLMPDGKMLIQGIVIRDAKYERYLRDIDFIRAYIFPGGCLPSISALTQAASRAGLRLVALDDFAPHYAETLRRWAARFDENRNQIRQMGYDETFLRMWEYYLRYCEAAFEERQVSLVQAVFAKRACQTDEKYGAIPMNISSNRAVSVANQPAVAVQE